MKKLLIAVSILVVLLVIGFFIFMSSLGSLVKNGVNRYGPEITQSKVVLQEADISPFSGQGTLTNLAIGNPEGWESENAFTLGEIAIHVEPKSLTGDHIVVNSLVIRSPQITYENRLTNSNLQDLMKNIQEAAGPRDSTTTPTQGEEVKLEIKQLRMENAKVTVMGAGQSATVDMPALVMENLGTREGGLTPKELTIAVMKEVTAQAIRAGARVAVEKGVLEKGLKELLGGDSKTEEQPKTP